MDIWLIILFLLAGFTAGFFEKIACRVTGLARVMTRVGLVILLAAMGAKIGVDRRIYTRLSTIGWQAFLLAVGSILGSIILVYFLLPEDRLQGKESVQAEEPEEEIPRGGENLGMTLTIITAVTAGILAGFFLLPHSFFRYLDPATTYALAALLLGVGVDIGRKKDVFYRCRELGWSLLLLPLMVAVGSILGSILTGYLLGLQGNEAAAVGAGFGWYSLSGILLAKIYSVELGSLAFLSNVFRELLTIIFLPFIVHYLGKITAIAPGGATTMDVTLPLIKETAGEETVVPAFVNGVVLSALVPLLVPFLVHL